MYKDLLESKQELVDNIKGKVYKGVRIGYSDKDRGKCIVTVDDRPLEMVFDAGFDWGYRGVAAKNLAQSILNDVFRSEYAGLDFVIPFVREVITLLPTGSWELPESIIENWMDVQIREKERNSREDIRKENGDHSRRR